MVFSSLIFLFAFLPLTAAVYFVVPFRYRNLVLFVLSAVFYGWGEPIYILVMLYSICVAYFFGFGIEKHRVIAPKRAKRLLAASVLLCFAALLFFKYSGFILDNLRVLIPAIPRINLPELPIGISFYTFQIVSYSVDVYRGETAAQKSFTSFGAYVTLFPQLIAGPIVRYRDVNTQLECRHESISKAASGIARFCCGLAKKLLLADSCAALARSFAASGDTAQTVLGAWVSALAFAFQIYFDFSGYSDMAIGLGRLFGFEFLENFNYPYISKSITDFWRRWHISLSTWFREYVYIPLGGNRRGKVLQYRNIAIVWLLTGLWHGAAWNFVLWGCYFGILLTVEKAFFARALEKAPVFVGRLYALVAVLFGWVLFSATDLASVGNSISLMFGGGLAATQTNFYDLIRYLPLIAVCAFGCTPLPKKLYTRIAEKCPVATPVMCVLTIIICTAYMVSSTYSPFLYFNF